jgi:hypothetical protein
MSVSLVVIGESFHLRIDLDNRISGFIDDQEIDETLPAMPEGAASHHYSEMEQFVAAVRSGDYSTLLSPYSDAVKSLVVILTMNQSIEHQAPMAVPSTEI